MNSTQPPDAVPTAGAAKAFPSRQIIHLVLQLAALAFLLNFCFNILSPFINPLLWGGIFAIALLPLHQRLKKFFKGRGALAAVVITIVFLLVFILPAALFAIRTASEARDVLNRYQAGEIQIAPPAENVKNWPLVGEKVYNSWQKASTDLNAYIEQNPPWLKSFSAKLVDLIKSTGSGLVLLAVAIILSGVLLSYSRSLGNFASTFFNRLIGNSKVDVASIATVTIKNVVKGILGVAFIQSALAGVGMVIGGVPYAGIWALVCMILGIIQVGMLPVSIGVIIYIWSEGTTTTAIILTIWMLLVGLLDNFLKPLIMGKGAPVPMLVIFLGAIGGFIFSGFIGLFTGAVILSLGYCLFDLWIKGSDL